MHIRAITETELDVYAGAAGTDAANAAVVKEMAANIWASGVGHPEWCFLAEVDGQAVGRIGFLCVDQELGEFGIYALALPWDAEYETLGRELVTSTFQTMQAHGTVRVNCELNSHWSHFDKLQTVLLASGFALRETVIGMMWLDAGQPLTVPERLQFRSLAELGEEVYLDAVQRIARATQDHAAQATIAMIGVEEYVRRDLVFIRQGHEFEPEWWHLAYDSGGALAGYVEPVLMPSAGENVPRQGTIPNIGMLEEQRGNGYLVDLLAKGTATLRENGAAHVFCSADKDDAPLTDAYLEVGYQLTHTNYLYQTDLRTG